VYFLALATGYDGTLAYDGKVAEATVAALRRFKATGRKLVLVTGRILEDLIQAFPEVALFDRVPKTAPSSTTRKPEKSAASRRLRLRFSPRCCASER
jgi:hypothetical protein